MRIRLLHHPVRAVRRAARMQGRAAPREARNREIEGAPEKVRGTRLALEPRAAHLEHAIGLRERAPDAIDGLGIRSEEHTSDLQSLMRISSAVFCLHKKHSPC